MKYVLKEIAPYYDGDSGKIIIRKTKDEFQLSTYRTFSKLFPMSSQIILNLLTLLLIAQAVGVSSLTGTEKTPYHTSTLSGANYIQEILGSHSPNKRRIYDALRMPETTFLRLVQWVKEKGILHATKKISTEEQLAMFLKIVGEGASNRTTADRFQHSGDTVSRHFNLVLEGLLGLYPEFVTTPTPGIPYEIKRNPKFFPFFKDCLGAADGTHIYAKIKEEDAVQFRNRKGQITQNVLGICKFNLQFTYIYPGWEGSAHDARVLEAALGGDLKVLDGKYYLVDAGYALRKGFLTPYQGVRCHLKEQAQSQQR